MKTDLVDRKSLEALCNGNTERIAKYITIFLGQESIFMNEISSILTNNDIQRLRKFLHHILPQLSYTGLKETHMLVEKMQRSFDGNSSYPINDRLEAQLDAIKESLCEGIQVLKEWCLELEKK